MPDQTSPANTTDATAELSADELQADWERAALYHHEEQQADWEEGEYEQMMFEVEGY